MGDLDKRHTDTMKRLTKQHEYRRNLLRSWYHPGERGTEARRLLNEEHPQYFSR